MPNAIDVFRAQKEAVDQVHARLTEVTCLVQRLRFQVDAIAQDEKLREVIRDEQSWLARTREALVEVRRFREQEANGFWPAVWRRWIAAIALAMATVAAAGAGYSWVARPYSIELVELRWRTEFADAICQRIATMTPTERRRFDELIKGTRAKR